MALAAVVLAIALGEAIALMLLVRHRTAVQRWEQADADRRAPVVIATPTDYCALSPSGGYLWAPAGYNRATSPFLYEAATGRPVTLPYPRPAASRSAIWLRDDLLLSYGTTRRVEGATPNDAYDVPVGIWLADARAGTVAAVADLPPDRRAEIDRLADERTRTFAARQRGPAVSPVAGQPPVVAPPAFATQPCADGQRADGTGFYYIERQRGGMFSKSGLPGPVRFLRAYPPPPSPHP